MKYNDICTGRFIERPNRFIAFVEIGGVIERCHVKNTGRCKELFVKDAKVVLQHFRDTKRSTKFDIIAVYKDDLLINIDSQAPNKVFGESISSIFSDIDIVRPEYAYGDSRIDFYAESGKKRLLIEVKGVTLENKGDSLFPDAPTERGLKHIKELEKSLSDGYEPYLFFVIQMSGMRSFSPNYKMHEEFGMEIEKAHSMGVGVLAYDCIITEDSMILNRPVEIRYRDHS